MTYEERKAELKELLNQVKTVFEDKGYNLESINASYIDRGYYYNVVVTND